MRITRAAIAAAILLTVAGCTSDPAQPVSPMGGATTAAAGDADPVLSGSASLVVQGEAGPIPNADEFLASTETAWRDSLTADANSATVSDQARCYYQDAGSQRYRVVCGPVRRAGADATAVWDLLGMKIDTDTNKAGRDYYSDKKSQPLPKGALTRPDGQTPPAPSELAEPDAPAAPADLFAQVDPATMKPVAPVTIDPSTATLLTPYGKVAITASANLDQVTGITELIAGDLPDLGKTYAPAAGYRLITFTVETTPDVPAALKALDDADGQTGNEKADPAKVIFDRGDTVDLSKVLYLDGTESGGGSGSMSFVASVRDGADPTLTFNLGGHAQTLNIATATAEPDPQTAAFAFTKPVVEVNKKLPTFTGKIEGDPEVTFDDDAITYDLTAKQVVFTPYTVTGGWAPAGTMWAVITGTEGPLGDEITRNWTATVNGKQIKVTNVAASNNSGDTYAASFPVPLDTKTADFTLSTVFTYTANADGAKTEIFKPDALTFEAGLG